jgi:hypothetical protein
MSNEFIWIRDHLLYFTQMLHRMSIFFLRNIREKKNLCNICVK